MNSVVCPLLYSVLMDLSGSPRKGNLQKRFGMLGIACMKKTLMMKTTDMYWMEAHYYIKCPGRRVC
ncbi:hypothetical protein DPMN_172741 [Dreissena polymorpha]|uniref:Uncharacterized protein n=1 Tax=Dreissena polymorpha TaxID=45954 RepID=A0A9D4IFF4_DREPO|nr:hypothetical protein DPMN_172741 [Dreissena polymorpha]